MASAVALPMVVLVLACVARLLAAMQDEGGAAVLDRLALAGAIVWIVTLVGLVVVVAINNLISDNRE